MKAVFVHDQEAAVEGLKSGEKIEAMDSEYGRNELLVDFLRELGVWDALTSMKTTKKPNGKPQDALSGAVVLFSLAHLGALEKADPVLRDGLLMTEAGFTLKEVKEATKQNKGVVHRDTLRNHLQRIPMEESKRAFYRCLELFRSKKLIRGKVYAADGFKIRVYGKTYEGAGKAYDPDEKETIRGYKVVILLNLTPEREYVVGCAIGPVQADERDLLREILDDLERHGIPPKSLIDILVMDRGYWGADFLNELKSKYGIDYLTLVPRNVSLYDDVILRVGSGDLPLKEVKLVKNGGFTVTGVGYLPGFDAENESGKKVLRCNVVYSRGIDDEGKEFDMVFATSHQDLRPEAYVKLYWRRWVIENEGIRHLSQVWGIKKPISRKLDAIFANIVMILCLSNSVRAFEAKYPKEKDSTKEKMRRRGQKSHLLDRGCIVFLPEKRIYAVMSAVEFARLVKERTMRKFKRLLSSGLSTEEAMEEVMREL